MKIETILICSCLFAMSACASITSPLINAAGKDDTTEVQALISKGSVIDERDNSGMTPLMNVANSGHQDIVRLLVEKGSDVNAYDKTGWTPLMWASYKEHLSIVKFLIEKGANIKAKDIYSGTSLIHAAAYNQADVVSLLIDYGADTTIKNSYYNTALRQDLYDRNTEAVAVIRKKTRATERVESLTMDEALRLPSRYNPPSDAYSIPSGSEKDHQIAIEDCNILVVS